jgi:DNA-binding CsgD family transcriptional regulator
MGYKELSKKELTETLDIIQHLLSSKNEADIKAMLERTKNLVCSEYSICGLATHDSNGLAEVVNIINGSYHPDWFSAYKEKRLYTIDPIIWHHYKFFEAQEWKDTYKRYGDMVSPQFIHDAGSFNLNYGISSSLKSPHSGLASIVSFANGKNHFGTHQKIIIDILTPYFHQALVRLHKEAKRELSHLTPMEKEIIKWIKEGKTSWEISVILNIGEWTIKSHIGNINNKLDAINEKQAAAIAMEQGEIG